LSRAGTAWNSRSSSTTVPRDSAAGRTGSATPPSTAIIAAAGRSPTRLVTVSRPTAPSAASASPRKPKLAICTRSEPSILDVAWRATASGSASGAIPCPSSDTRSLVLPPADRPTSIRVAPASSAFSISSLTAEAGRSTTSPAAIRLIAAASSGRISGEVPPILGFGMPIPQGIAGRRRFGQRSAAPRCAVAHCGDPTGRPCPQADRQRQSAAPRHPSPVRPPGGYRPASPPRPSRCGRAHNRSARPLCCIPDRIDAIRSLPSKRSG
jgi:hypothetical protein